MATCDTHKYGTTTSLKNLIVILSHFQFLEVISSALSINSWRAVS